MAAKRVSHKADSQGFFGQPSAETKTLFCIDLYAQGCWSCVDRYRQLFFMRCNKRNSLTHRQASDFWGLK
jgi:hypothetical protein